MKAPIRLGQVAIVSNVASFTSGLLARAYPIAVLHLALFPLNIMRLIEIKRLTAKIKASHAADTSVETLSTFGSLRRYAAGSPLVRKGERGAEAHPIFNESQDRGLAARLVARANAPFFWTSRTQGGGHARPPMPRYRFTGADAEAIAAYLESLGSETAR